MNAPTLADLAQRKRDLVLAAKVRELELKHLNRLHRSGYVPTHDDFLRIAGAIMENEGVTI